MEKAPERLEQLMKDYGPAVLGLARGMLRDRHAAEDVFQATFVKAYCRALPFKDGNHARAWLLRVASNDCISRIRSPWRHRVSLMGSLPARGTEALPASDIDKALRLLPPCYRDAVWLHYYAGYGTDEIAELAGIPAATVRTRLRRARQRLRELLDGDESYDGS